MEKLIKEQQGLKQSLSTINSLLIQANQIEQNAQRFTDLEKILPKLESLLTERKRLVECEQYIKGQEFKATELQGVIEKGENELKKSRANLISLQDKQCKWQAQKDDAQSTLIKMAPQIEELKQLAQVQTDLKTLEQELAIFPAELDEQVANIREEVQRLGESKNTIGWLKQFAKARDDWHEAKTMETSNQEAASKLSEQMLAISNAVDETQEKTEGIKLIVDESQKRITQLDTLLTQAKEQLERLEEIEGQPTCDYCGQPLTPEHLESERQKLNAEIQRIKDELQQEKNNHAKTLEEHSKLFQQINDLTQQQQKLGRDKQKAENELGKAKDKQVIADEQATNALQSIPQNYQQKILPSANIEWFATQFPTQDDLDDMSRQIEQGQGKKQELSELAKQAKQRDKWLAQKQPLAGQIKQLEEKYPPQMANHIRHTDESAKTKQTEADAELGKLIGFLGEAESAVKNKNEEVKKANEKHQEIITAIKAKKASKKEINRAIANIGSGLNDEWRNFIAVLTEDNVQTLKAEKVGLSGTNELWMELQQARNDKATQKKRLADVEQDLSQIPQEAKRSINELEQEEEIAYDEQKKIEQLRNQVQREKQDLESRQKNREDLEKDRRKAEKYTKLYKKLADLLGPNYLQRHLLTQSEIGIVTNANEILDRISGGKLRLDFQNGQGIQDEAQATATKALDVVAYNRETSDEPIHVSSLSGGQRFRVSISFALGIGQYLSQENKRVESVIIDEGFGGLDEAGLKEVIDELYYLKDSLKRIIVVSHQEEFTNAFKNRYEIRLEDKTSRVERV